MKRLALAVFIACGTVTAADFPVSSGMDQTIQRVNYNADDIVVINTEAGAYTRIVLSNDEVITDLLNPFPEGYSITHNDRVVSILPQSVQMGDAWVTPDDQWRRIIQVQTTKRFYTLVVEISKYPAYRVHFQYPDEVEAARVAAVKVEQAAREEAAIKAQPKPIHVENLDYEMQPYEGSESITPLTVHDDGNHTFITFSKNAEMPVAYLEEDEAAADTDVESDRPHTLRVKSINKHIMLRKGNRKAVLITNNAFSWGPE